MLVRASPAALGPARAQPLLGDLLIRSVSRRRGVLIGGLREQLPVDLPRRLVSKLLPPFDIVLLENDR